jgi:hypothetical protein
LQDFFYDGWKHKRIDAELEKMMRVSAKRAIAGQKGGIGSALARMKLENRAQSRSVPARAIAAPLSGHAAARVDDSHSYSPRNLPSGDGRSADPPAQLSRAGTEKPAIAVSAELAAYVAKRAP